MQLSEFLKSNTGSYHDEVELGLGSGRIFSKNYSTEDYSKLIYCNYLFIKAFEEDVFNRVSPEISEAVNLQSRRKMPSLEKEIQQLKINEEERKSEISIENPWEALGILYVMEGSTLGGNVIAKQFSKTPGFTDFKFYYFGVYGEETGSKWKIFKETIDAKTPEEHHPKVLAGTIKAYQYLLSVL